MVSEKYKQWWGDQPFEKKPELIKNKALELNRIHKSLRKATKAEMDFGFNRTGPRGGRFTSLNAKSERYAKSYHDCADQLKFMVAKF